MVVVGKEKSNTLSIEADVVDYGFSVFIKLFNRARVCISETGNKEVQKSTPQISIVSYQFICIFR
ncbi:hypothetical protein CU098_008372, partial [Rhizopus stolonifer]